MRPRLAMVIATILIASTCSKDSPTAPSPPPPPPPIQTIGINGYVIDGTNDRTLPGATVILADSANKSRSTQSDAGGHYGFAAVPVGRTGLTTTRPGYISSFDTVTIGPGDFNFNITLRVAPPEVEYRLTGSARHCSATYENSSHGTNQHGVSIPYSYSWSGARSGDFLYMSCQIDQGSDFGNLTVAIYKNGSLYRSGFAAGFPNIATASGSY